MEGKDPELRLVFFVLRVVGELHTQDEPLLDGVPQRVEPDDAGMIQGRLEENVDGLIVVVEVVLEVRSHRLLQPLPLVPVEDLVRRHKRGHLR